MVLLDFRFCIGRGQNHIIDEQAGTCGGFLQSRNERLEDFDTDIIRVIVDDLSQEEKTGIGDGLGIVEAVLHERDAVLDMREIRPSGTLLKHDGIDVLHDKAQLGEFLHRCIY